MKKEYGADYWWTIWYRGVDPCNLGIKTQMIKQMFKAVKEFVLLNLTKYFRSLNVTNKRQKM